MQSVRMDPRETEDMVFTADQAARLIGVARSTFYRDIRSELPHVDLPGRRVGYRRSDVLRWVEGRVVLPSAFSHDRVGAVDRREQQP